MTKQISHRSENISIIVGAALMAAFAGCLVEQPGQPSGYRGRPAVQVQATVAFQDDYDYYPGYETYYSRNRHEFVYRDGNAWVRRPEPTGVTSSVLFAAPTVRLDFHDSPEQHHSAVVQQYPKNWKGQEAKHDDKKDDKKDEKKDRRDDEKKQ
jgi:hypothetical protein